MPADRGCPATTPSAAAAGGVCAGGYVKRTQTSPERSRSSRTHSEPPGQCSFFQMGARFLSSSMMKRAPSKAGPR